MNPIYRLLFTLRGCPMGMAVYVGHPLPKRQPFNDAIRKRHRTLSRTCAAMMLAMFLASYAAAFDSTVFYAGAHQDDWQLFMTPNSFADAQAVYPEGHPQEGERRVKVVFIYTTAGDAGYGNGPTADSGSRVPYYRARELGAEAAMRFVSTRGTEYRARTEWDNLRINGHRMIRWSYKNAVAYYLRLPDGGLLGYGYGSTGGQSLKNLYEGGTITEINRRAHYSSWQDLVMTIESIVLREALGTPNVWMNAPLPIAESGGATEPGHDHSDHIHTGLLMIDAVSSHPCINMALFSGYQTAHLAPNLSENQKVVESATWGATIAGLLESTGAWNTFGFGHNRFLGRNYFRRVEGSGACTF